MTTSISIGSKIICSDGEWGRSTAAIVDPASRKLTHIAVVQKSLMHGEEKLVPISMIEKTTRDAIYLRCASNDMSNLEAFTRTHYLEMENGEAGYAYSQPYITMYSDVAMTPEVSYLTVQDQLVPEGEVVLHRGMSVEATDGPVGQVGELLIDSTTGQLTHFVLMKGHRWGKKEVVIELTAVDHMQDEVVYLKIDKATIEQLPSLPTKRDWNEVNATDLELLVWTYEGKDFAEKALKKVEGLSKQYSIELLNAAVIIKDADGKTHVHEDKKVHSKAKVAFGIALGGLAGLVIGPVALAAGAIAGGIAGKKSANKVEVGFSEAKLQKLNESLVPGGSALVLLVEHRWFTTLQLELAETGGELIHERLSDITVDELANKMAADEKDG